MRKSRQASRGGSNRVGPRPPVVINDDAEVYLFEETPAGDVIVTMPDGNRLRLEPEPDDAYARESVLAEKIMAGVVRRLRADLNRIRNRSAPPFPSDEDRQNRSSVLQVTLDSDAVAGALITKLGASGSTGSAVIAPRLLSAEEAAIYLSLSKREVYNMISNRQLEAVIHGRRKMLDIRDLDNWIDRNKS